jgi:hypothetical protein
MKFRTIVPIFAFALAALTACGGGKSASNAASGGAMQSGATSSSAPMTAASGARGAVPDCGAVTAVWVNLKSKVFHEAGDPYYGKTAHGEYLCPAQAKAQGFHKSHGFTSAHKKSASTPY